MIEKHRNCRVWNGGLAVMVCVCVGYGLLHRGIKKSGPGRYEAVRPFFAAFAPDNWEKVPSLR